MTAVSNVVKSSLATTASVMVGMGKTAKMASGIKIASITWAT
eukprot:CAMPEP_0172456250 /NCGR_PEP_ID=MMETSP1065-20121228/14608_1 /TAXON_ID=265537 /ORGANISM="Amphiprora paludosa, Strain CCMP125" /LENGTH=41 /DNA_ID= /DNA_START= /DNA_END= /DNA_ORIENTATION=